ncbi:ParA family protein [Chryseobacterium populi]|uniref:ATPase involved in chromosome partitioning n=1 Tax=Chryseobacterium populi TaxID=1144316 RepID=J3CM13_9FLAO|nr:ParA family protein [Chryseobacterium populi]EJL74364.1 ATPase involved in chromosome partitioning [Chryseobacterium populi]
METKKKTVFIAFSSQKGGVGKSAFTALAASTLHYRLGYNVAVYDCDFPQHSLIKMRERDMKSIMENELFKRMAYKQFTTINKKAYPILQHGAEGVLEAAHDFMDSLPVPLDFLFFDLPGTVNTPGILSALAGMNHIFTPIIADRVVMESTLVFSQLMKDVIMKRGENCIETINLFWNQVDGRERSPLYDIYNRLIDELGLSVMNSQVTGSLRFRKDSEAHAKTVFRSTLLPPDEKLMKACRLDEFMTEFIRTVQL